MFLDQIPPQKVHQNSELDEKKVNKHRKYLQKAFKLEAIVRAIKEKNWENLFQKNSSDIKLSHKIKAIYSEKKISSEELARVNFERKLYHLRFENLTENEKTKIECFRKCLNREQELFITKDNIINRTAQIQTSKLEAIAFYIKHKNWEVLLKTNAVNPDFFCQLIALYCQEKISFEVLARVNIERKLYHPMFENLSENEKTKIEYFCKCLNREKELFITEDNIINRTAQIKTSKLEAIAFYIKHKNWEVLLKTNAVNSDFFCQLIALYCQEKISFEELARANFEKNISQDTFQELTENEVQLIEDQYNTVIFNNKIYNKMVFWIKNGNWENLLYQNINNANFSYQLIALHCANKISLPELATAVAFDNCRTSSTSTFNVYKMNEENLKKEVYSEWQELIESDELPDNLKFFISIPMDFDHDPYIARSICAYLNFGPPTSGSFYFQGHAIVSLGAAKVFYEKKHKVILTPIFGLSSNRKKRMTMIRKGISDVAIFLRGKTALFHGRDNLLYGQMHDLSHARDRAKTLNIQHYFLDLAEYIEENILPKLGDFRKKLIDKKEENEPLFVSKPTINEGVGYVLDRLVETILDGFYKYSETAESQIEEIKEQISWHTRNSLARSKFEGHEDFINGVEKELKTILGSLELEIKKLHEKNIPN